MHPEPGRVVAREDADFFLASASPRRRALLASLGYRFAVLPVAVAEEQRPGEAPEHYVRRTALDKARAGRRMLEVGDSRCVLGADTEVVIDGCVLGKPASELALLGMLGRLSGRSHQVLSAVAIDDGGEPEVAIISTEVRMRSLEASEIRAYWASGEPCDKAGGYAIQGLAAEFVTSIDGSYTAVVGLPLPETAALLRARGIVGRRGEALHA